MIKPLGVSTAITAALLVVGVVGPGGDGDSADVAAETSPRLSAASAPPPLETATEASGSVSVDAGATASSSNQAGADGSASASVESGAATETTNGGGDTTSTTVEDGHDGDAGNRLLTVGIGEQALQVAGAGEVAVGVEAGKLVVLDVSALAGWSFEVEKAAGDQIRIVFRNGAVEVEYEAQLEGGRIKIETETRKG